MNEVNTLWLFVPGGVFLIWGIVLCFVVGGMNKILKPMRPDSPEYNPQFENRKNIMRLASYSIGAGANRFLLAGISLISIGMAFS